MIARPLRTARDARNGGYDADDHRGLGGLHLRRAAAARLFPTPPTTRRTTRHAPALLWTASPTCPGQAGDGGDDRAWTTVSGRSWRRSRKPACARTPHLLLLRQRPLPQDPQLAGRDQDPIMAAPPRLKGHRGTLWDGGVRMPAIMSWRQPSPAAGSARGRHHDGHLPDDARGRGRRPARYELDGLSLLDLIAHDAASPDWIAWNLRGQRAIRRGIGSSCNGIFRDSDERPPRIGCRTWRRTSTIGEPCGREPGKVWCLRELLRPLGRGIEPAYRRAAGGLQLSYEQR